MDSMIHMHVQYKRLRMIAEAAAQAQKLFCHQDGTTHCFQISIRYKTVEIRNIQVFIQMDCIIKPVLFGNAHQFRNLFETVHPVFREIHIQFDKPETQFTAEDCVFFQRSVFNERRHSKLHLYSPYLLSVLRNELYIHRMQYEIMALVLIHRTG